MWRIGYSVDQPPSIFLGVILGPVRRSKPKMKIQQWANKRKLAESWSYSYGIKPAKDRVESWERRCNDSTCSFWLASYPIRRVFLQHISGRVFVEYVINKGKSCCHFAWKNGSMFVYPTNMAMILDLKGFLISQKLFLSTSEYYNYHQWRMWNIPDFWNSHNHSSLSKVYRFTGSCRVFFY